MGTNFLKNLAGFSLSPEEMEDIPYQKLELNFHVTLKHMQAFGLLGTMIFGPFVAMVRSSTRNLKGVIQKSTKFGKYGVIASFFTGPMMTYGMLKKKNASEDSIYDRCYRLRHNRNQVRVDQASIIGGATGLVLFPLVLKTCPIFGSLFGMSTGLISMAIYNNKIAKE